MLLLCCMVTVLYGADLFEHIDKAEKYLNSRYERGSAAHRTARMELMKIASSDKSDAEKIAALKKRFPEAFKLSEAEEKYLAAAEKGDANVQFFLGGCYHIGIGVEKDLKQALYWLRKAADQGHENAKKALKNFGY